MILDRNVDGFYFDHGFLGLVENLELLMEYMCDSHRHTKTENVSTAPCVEQKMYDLVCRHCFSFLFR
jgi:hypothetical protein